MENSLALIMPFIFIGGALTLIYFIVQQQYQQINNNFIILAEKLNLQVELPEMTFWAKFFVKRYPELHGVFEERYNVRVYMFSQGGGKNKQTYTAFSIICKNPRRQTMTLHREGVFQKIGKAIGMQRDIELRDEEFDKRYILKSSDALFVKELFADPDFREFFIKYDYAFAGGNLRLSQNNLEFQRQGILNSEFERKRLVVAIRLAVKIAERLEDMG